MSDINAKLADLAKLIDGQVISNQLAVCVKGIIAGFPVKLEAIQAGYPFGITYSLETGHFKKTSSTAESFKLTILPKYARGKLSTITRFLFFERRGQKLGIAALDANCIFKYDNAFLAKKFAQYEGVSENIQLLEKKTHFNEMIIKSDAGLHLSQPTPFNALDLDLCKETFNTMACLGQVLFEAF